MRQPRKKNLIMTPSCPFPFACLNQPYMKGDFTPQHEKREGAA
jgi:hypothetical protein